jgi:hypothetical protein
LLGTESRKARVDREASAVLAITSAVEHQPATSGDSSRSKNHPAATMATTRPTVLCDCAAPLLEMVGSDECVFIPQRTRQNANSFREMGATKVVENPGTVKRTN